MRWRRRMSAAPTPSLSHSLTVLSTKRTYSVILPSTAIRHPLERQLHLPRDLRRISARLNRPLGYRYFFLFHALPVPLGFACQFSCLVYSNIRANTKATQERIVSDLVMLILLADGQIMHTVLFSTISKRERGHEHTNETIRQSTLEKPSSSTCPP